MSGELEERFQPKESENKTELIVGNIDEKKKNNVLKKSEETPSQIVAIARETAEIIERSDQETLNKMDDAELLEARLKILAGEKLTVTDELIVQMLGSEFSSIFSPALRIVETQLRERAVVQDEDANLMEPYDHQLIKQWARAYSGGKVIVHFANVRQVEREIDTNTGSETYIIPSKTDITHFLAAAQLVSPESPFQKLQIHSLAQNLKDSAVLLSHQRKQLSISVNGSGTGYAPLFDDSAIVNMYEKGRQLEIFVRTGQMPSKEITRDEYHALRQEIEKEEIIPQYYRQQSQDVLSDEVKQTDEYQKVEKLNNNRLLLFILGKNALADPAESGSFYTQWFDRIMDRGGRTPTGEMIGSEAEFNTWIDNHSDQVIRRIAPFINTTVVSEHLFSHQKAEKAILAGQEQGAKEALFHAISERGKEEQKQFMDYDFTDQVSFSHEKGEELSLIIENVFQPSELSKNVEARLAALPENAELQQRLDALNRAVAETYAVPQNSTLKNYEPILALRESEFACSIRSMVLDRLIEQHMGEEFIRLGGSEWKHSSLVVVDRKSLQYGKTPTGYYVSTGGPGGYEVVEITDDILKQPFMKPLVEAIYQDPNDVMIHLQLRPKDPSLLQARNITVGNVDKINESHVWINEATAKRSLNVNEPYLSPEMQLQDAQRALLLNPFSETALGLVVKLTAGNPNNEALYRTSLRKLQLLNPDLTEKKVLGEEDLTVNAFSKKLVEIDVRGKLSFTNIQIQDLVKKLKDQQGSLSITRADYLDPRQLESFRKSAIDLKQEPGTGDATIFDREKAKLIEQVTEALNHAITIDNMKPPLTTLKPIDFEMLVEHPKEWYSWKSNEHSDFFDGINDINSPLLESFKQQAQHAFLFTVEYHKSNPEVAVSLQKEMNTRNNTRFMHLMIRLGLNDKIPGQAQQLGIKGISEAMDSDGGRVGTALIKISTLLDTARNNKHDVDLLPTQKAKFIADIAAREELKLAEEGLGEYGSYYRAIETNAKDEYPQYYAKNLESVQKKNPTLSLDEQEIEALSNTAREITGRKLKNNFRYAQELLYCSQRFSKIATVGWSARGQWKSDAAKHTILGENLTQFMFGWIALTNQQERVLARRQMYSANRELTRGFRIKNGRVISRAKEVNEYTDGERSLMGEPLYNRTKNSGEVLSGGWRGPEYIDAHKLRLGEDIAKHTQLFLKLHLASGAGDINVDAFDFGSLQGWRLKKAKEEVRKLLYRESLFRGDIAEYYPEEIVSQFRLHDRNWGGNNSYSDSIRKQFIKQWGDIQYRHMLANDRGRNKLFNAMMNEQVFRNFGNPDSSDPHRDSSTNDQRSVAQYRYDQFRAKYDNVMSTIRQMAIMQNPPIQVDFTNLNNLFLQEPDGTERISAADIVKKHFKTANSNGESELNDLHDAMLLFKKFSRKNETINTLLYDKTFEDIYHRILRVDDMRVDLYEKKQKLKRNAGELVDKGNNPILIDSYTGRPKDSSQNNRAVWEDDETLYPVSSLFSADPSGDALERAWKDKIASTEQGEAELAEIAIPPDDGKKIEAMQAVANKKKDVDGWPGYIEAFEPLLEEQLADSETPEWAKILDIQSLPAWMQIAITEHQKNYGVKTTGMTPGEAVGLLDSLAAQFNGTEDAKEAAMQYLGELRDLVAVAPNDLVRRRLILLAISVLATMAVAAVSIPQEAVSMDIGR